MKTALHILGLLAVSVLLSLGLRLLDNEPGTDTIDVMLMVHGAYSLLIFLALFLIYYFVVVEKSRVKS